MSERKQLKDRMCKRCGAVLVCTARAMKEHAETCARLERAERAFGPTVAGRIPCDSCGVPIPAPPENAAPEELLCDTCEASAERAEVPESR